MVTLPNRLSPLALLTACLVVLFALPSWSTAKSTAIANRVTDVASEVSAVDIFGVDSIADDDNTDANDDDDEDNDASVAKAKAELKKAEALLRKAEAEAKKAKAKAEKATAEGKERKSDAEVEFDFSKLGEMIEKQIGSEFGPDFQKKMEELGEKIEKEIEGKFGPDFEKKMEEFGEKIGKEMEAKLGPGSEFEKKMKKLGKEMEAKFGPGSEFEKKMKKLGKEMEAKFGPGSDFEEKIKEQAETLSELQKKATSKPAGPAKVSTPGSAGAGAKRPTVGTDSQRERRIAEIEAQIRKLARELKALKDDDNQD